MQRMQTTFNLKNNESHHNLGYFHSQRQIFFENRDQENNINRQDSNYDIEQSPSFCTDEKNHTNNILDKVSYLASHPSEISSFGSSFIAFTEDSNWQRDCWIEKNKTNESQFQIKEQTYVPSLQSYHFNKTNEKQSSLQDMQFSQKLLSIGSEQLSQQKFIPEVKELTSHIDFLERQVFVHKREYLRMKSFANAVINAVKSILSQQVGEQLERYMIRNIQNINICQYSHQYSSSTQKFQSHLSKQFMGKLASESLQYSQDLNSKQLNETIQHIFTLGEIKNQPQHINYQSFQSQSSGKSTKRKLQNFKKTRHDKQNILTNQDRDYPLTERKERTQITEKNENRSSFIKKSQIGNCSQLIPTSKINAGINKKNLKSAFKDPTNKDKPKIQNMKNLQMNQSMKYLMSEGINTNQSQSCNQASYKSIKTQKKSMVATQLLCEVCKQCLQPNQFFKHLEACSKSTVNESKLNESQKVALNYTLMMENLFQMREQIESQIGLLQLSRQKSKEKQKNERQKLKRKLEEDLQKVTRIIEDKQKEMQLHLSRSMEEQQFGERLRSYSRPNKIKF